MLKLMPKGYEVRGPTADSWDNLVDLFEVVFNQARCFSHHLLLNMP